MKMDVKLLNANCSWEQVTFEISKLFHTLQFVASETG